MVAFVVRATLDTYGQPIEVHMVEDDAKRAVRKFNASSAGITYWYTRVPLKHKLLLVTEKGAVTAAAIIPTEPQPLMPEIAETVK